jgi:hypothetical protein
MRKIIDPTTREVTWERMRDVAAAHEHGDLEYIFPAGRLSQDPNYLMAVARDRLKTFTGADFLLPMGDTLAMIACAVTAAQQLDEDETDLQVLVWDSRYKKYFRHVLPVWKKEDQAVIIS